MDHVGQEVRRLREEKGWTQAQLAVYAGMGASALSQIENGKRNPSSLSLQKLSQALSVEVAAFFPKDQAPLPLEVVGAPERGSPSLTRQLEDWHYLFNRTVERWAREADGSTLFDTSEGAIAYSIAANSEATQLFEIIGERLLPTVDNLLPEDMAKPERRKLIQAISRLEEALEAVNEATWTAAPELDKPIEITEEMLDEAVEQYEAMPELEKRRLGREVDYVLEYLAKSAKAHAQTAENLRQYRSA